MNRYYWSFDEYNEPWTRSESSIEACIQSARECKKEGVVYIGELEPYTPYIDGERVIETILNEASYEYGIELTCDWEGVLSNMALSDKDELGDRVANVINEWLSEYNANPDFGDLYEIEKYNLSTGERVTSISTTSGIEIGEGGI